MLDIGWSEMAVIAVVALVVIGPKELPGVLRTIGQWMRRAKALAADFQSGIEEMAREAELAEMRKQMEEAAKKAQAEAAAANVSLDDAIAAANPEPTVPPPPFLDQPAEGEAPVADKAAAEAKNEEEPELPLPPVEGPQRLDRV